MVFNETVYICGGKYCTMHDIFIVIGVFVYLVVDVIWKFLQSRENDKLKERIGALEVYAFKQQPNSVDDRLDRLEQLHRKEIEYSIFTNQQLQDTYFKNTLNEKK